MNEAPLLCFVRHIEDKGVIAGAPGDRDGSLPIDLVVTRAGDDDLDVLDPVAPMSTPVALPSTRSIERLRVAVERSRVL